MNVAKRKIVARAILCRDIGQPEQGDTRCLTVDRKAPLGRAALK